MTYCLQQYSDLLYILTKNKNRARMHNNTVKPSCMWYRHVQSYLFGRRIKVGYNNVLREHGWRILINCQILLGIRQKNCCTSTCKGMRQYCLMWIARIAGVKSMKTFINLSWGIPPRFHLYLLSRRIRFVFILLPCHHPLLSPFPPPPHQETYMYISAEAEFMNVQFRWGFWALSWEFSDIRTSFKPLLLEGGGSKIS